MNELFMFLETGELILYQESWEMPETFQFSKTKVYFEILVNGSKIIDAFKYFFDFDSKLWEIRAILPVSDLPQNIKAILIVKEIN